MGEGLTNTTPTNLPLLVRVARCRAILEKIQWLKRERIERIQQASLRALLSHAYKKVPYYHKAFKNLKAKPGDIKSIEDLRKFPVLKRTQVAMLSKELRAKNFQRKIIPCETSGTTSTPVQFYRDHNDYSWGTAAMLRAFRWAGFKVQDKKAMIWNFRQHELNSMTFKIQNLLARTLAISVFQFSQPTMGLISPRLRRYNPKFIIGYASALYLLAKHCLDEGLDTAKPKAIFSTSSKLLAGQRKIVEEAFCCEVYDWYASREMLTMASECPHHSGLHVASDHVVLEFVKNGEHTAPGEEGKVLVTNLHNYSMPFIRYDIGDVGKPSNESCQCGRGLPLIESIEGRTYEIFVTSDGSFTTLRDLGTFFEDLPVKEFQIIQNTPDEIHVKVVKDIGYTQRHTAFIENNLKWAGKAKIAVETVNSIPFERSGKKRYLVSKVRFF
ncbi:MAG: phenylacetate--CoA ligase family protein [Candidatus Hodarchaeota archaeon]